MHTHVKIIGGLYHKKTSTHKKNTPATFSATGAISEKVRIFKKLSSVDEFRTIIIGN
jgi:hypothetical protein